MNTRQVNEWSYARRVVITVAIVGLAYLLWRLSGVVLLLFAAVLLAVVLAALAEFITRYTPIPIGWALGLTVLLMIIVLGSFLVLFGNEWRHSLN